MLVEGSFNQISSTGSFSYFAQVKRAEGQGSEDSPAGSGQLWENDTPEASSGRRCCTHHTYTGTTFILKLFVLLICEKFLHFALCLQGFNIKTVQSGEIKLNVWDIGGKLSCFKLLTPDNWSAQQWLWTFHIFQGKERSVLIGNITLRRSTYWYVLIDHFDKSWNSCLGSRLCSCSVCQTKMNYFCILL